VLRQYLPVSRILTLLIVLTVVGVGCRLPTAPPTFQVVYDENGATSGSPPVDPNEYHSGQTVIVAAAGTMLRSGYYFTGWNTEADGTGTGYSPGYSFTIGNADIELYASWETYRAVYYDENGADSGTVPADPNQYEQGDTVVVLSHDGSLLRAGFSFVGWDTQADGAGTRYDPGETFTMGADDVTLYARWTSNPTYSVVYHGNGNDGGTVPVDGNLYETGETATVAGPGTLSLTGHYFYGWDTESDGSGTRYDPGDELAIGADDWDLYAVWEPYRTVAYDDNGADGGSAPVDGNLYEEGETATVADAGTLVLTDHYFAGWDTEPAGDGTRYQTGDDLVIGADDVTLYAVWELFKSVVYDGNDSDSGTVPLDTNLYREGDAVVVLNHNGSLARSGCFFVGWDTQADSGGTSYDPGDVFLMGDEDVTLYAVWSPYQTYGVAYDGNGNDSGAAPADPIDYTVGATVTVLGSGSLGLTDHYFDGWNTEAGGAGTAYDPGDSFAMGYEDVVLYAQWEPYRTVSYDGNGNEGGDVPVDATTYEIGDTVVVLGNPGGLFLTGYYLAGWNTEPGGGGEQYSMDDTFTMGVDDVVLYAIWLPFRTVTYDPNDADSGTVPVDSGYYEAGDIVTVLDNSGSLARSGYLFAGWNTATDGSGEHHPVSSTFEMGTEDVTLYARWISTTTPFVSIWQTGNTTGGSSGADQISLPLVAGGTYDCIVDWGDDEQDWITTFDEPSATHAYLSAGEYTVTIYGELGGFSFDGTGDRAKILEITDWGGFGFGNEGSCFDGATNLTVSATDAPDLSGTTTLYRAFAGCSALATVPDIGLWDVSDVTDMSFVFYNSPLFNGDVSDWDVSSATTMDRMFQAASAFNQDIGDWQTDDVTSMVAMFANTDFNQDIGDWDVASVVSFRDMFYYAESFNQDISGWTPLIGSDLSRMFYHATAFDQPIGGWNTSAATTMEYMFALATSFDQDIGTWDVSGVTNMANMFQGAGLSTANYDALLNGWADLPSLQDSVNFHAGSSVYSAAGAPGRAILEGTWGWTITDGGGP
jgi:uncharacterized repeat protein (TIGR02543 family)